MTNKGIRQILPRKSALNMKSLSITENVGLIEGQFQVIRKVQLLSPSGPEFPDLLLGPGSTYNIRTNKDHSHTVHYSVLDGADVLTISSGKWCSLRR